MNYQIVIFGYDEYAKEIARGFNKQESSIQIYLLDETSCKQAVEDGYKAELVELDDDWLVLAENFDIEKLKCFCSLSNDAQNVFLTISLRAQYSSLEIISLATSEQSAQKLRLAGASKAIAKLEATAHIIVESLERPIVVKVMNDIIYKSNELLMEEFIISKTSLACNKYLSELMKICEDFDVLILTLSDENKDMNFTFTAEYKTLKLEEGSVLVIMGKIQNIRKFEREIL
ncbi:MAG: hypothetical protein COA44_14175 [Arcobacter sp.]|nr:MAG: hypothetical protein COA44_14175 [Arcobacter sp.]